MSPIEFFGSLFRFFQSWTRDSTPCRVDPSICLSVHPFDPPSVPSVHHNSELRAVFSLLPLPNRPRLSYPVTGLVFPVFRFNTCLIFRRKMYSYGLHTKCSSSNMRFTLKIAN